ncbi:hypothetical protein EJB05_10673, partial [Eragrostis curvula]
MATPFGMGAMAQMFPGAGEEEWRRLLGERTNELRGTLLDAEDVARAAVYPRKPEAPWLVLPAGGRRTAALFSLSDGRAVAAHVPRPPRRRLVTSCGLACDGGLLGVAPAPPQSTRSPVRRRRSRRSPPCKKCLDDKHSLSGLVPRRRAWTLIRFEDSAAARKNGVLASPPSSTLGLAAVLNRSKLPAISSRHHPLASSTTPSAPSTSAVPRCSAPPHHAALERAVD